MSSAKIALNPHMTITRSLLKALLGNDPLIGNLPESNLFSVGQLTLPSQFPNLNLEQKLGHLYEDALAILFESSPNFDLLARNLQIQKDHHTTLGELDFLLREHATGQLIHLELATKFYLAVETDDGLELPGPDARDNYFKKLARLRSHQLQLPLLFKEHLPETFRHESIVTQHLIQGALFDHVTSSTPAKAGYLSPSCRRGKWLRSTELQEHFPTDTHFQMIPKSLWPVPFNLLDGYPLETWSPDSSLTRCLMVRVDKQIDPYFIAPPGYPTIA